MAKCHRLGAGSRSWTPAISASAIRRRILEAVACGCGSRHSNRRWDREPKPKPNLRSDSLSELLKAAISDSSSDDEADTETRRKIEASEELKNVVKGLQWERCGERRREAATRVRKLARDDGDMREAIAMLGAIPPLIAMIDCGDIESKIEALYALLNLGIGNDANKAVIVKAGAVHKMLHLLELLETLPPPSISEAIIANFFSLTALDANKPIVGSSSGAIAFLISSFKSPTSSQSQHDSLRALLNLSLSPSNLRLLTRLDLGLVPALFSSICDPLLSDRILSVLSNLVPTFEGRQEISKCNESIPILLDALNWIDAPACQEKAAYILMVIAHKSESDRALMIKLGIESALLELILVGSTLAQKRASRILEILRVEDGKGKQHVSEGWLQLPLAAMSAPLEEKEAEAGASEERRAVKELVNESLEKNLKRIVKRANLVRDFGPLDHAKGVGFCASSKSLPF